MMNARTARAIAVDSQAVNEAAKAVLDEWHAEIERVANLGGLELNERTWGGKTCFHLTPTMSALDYSVYSTLRDEGFRFVLRGINGTPFVECIYW